jgi:hypothetical protein
MENSAFVAVKTLDYSSVPIKRMIPPIVAIVGAVLSSISVILGISLTLCLAPILIEWPGHNTFSYRQYLNQFYFVALPLCAFPLAGLYLAWQANRLIVLCRACIWAGALVWLSCWWFHR